MASNTRNIHKLQQALNNKGYKLLYSTSQFYSEQQDRPITVYHIKRVMKDPTTEKVDVVELFKATSQIRILLYLRDMWYEANGKEAPQDNTVWNKIKQQSQELDEGE